MTNILAVNLRDLERRYLYASDAKEAVALLDGSTSPDNDTKIRELLRHHSQKPITSKKELRLRQAFDELLGFYSLVEVGCLAGFLEAVLPDYFATRAREHLSSAAVQKYYEQNYPLLLPRLLRKRAEKAYSLRENESTTATSLYMQFLEVNSLCDDEDVKTFLWFLEDGSIKGHSLDNTIRVLSSPWRYTGTLLKPMSWQSPVDQSIRGFGKFLEFCIDFDSLLSRSDGTPLLRSAMWHYHSYWFVKLRQHLRGKLAAMIEQIKSMSRSKAAVSDNLTADEIKSVLWRVVDPRNGEYLENAAGTDLAGTLRSDSYRSQRIASPRTSYTDIELEDNALGLKHREVGVFDQAVSEVTVDHPDTKAYYDGRKGIDYTDDEEMEADA